MICIQARCGEFKACLVTVHVGLPERKRKVKDREHPGTHSKTISSETLAVTVVMKGLEEAHHELIDVDGQILEIWVKPVNRSVPETNGVSFHDGTS